MSIHVHASKKWVSVCICFSLFRDVCVHVFFLVFVRYVCVHVHLHVIKMCQYTHVSKCVFVHVHTCFGLFRSIDMYLCVCEMCMCVHLCGCV